MIVLFALGCRPATPPSIQVPPSPTGVLDDTGVPVDTDTDPDTATDPVDTAEPVDTATPLDTDAWWRSADVATVDGASVPFDTLRTDLPLEVFAPASQGRELFMAAWGHGPSTPVLLDGLGPVFHADSCLACHPTGGRPLAYVTNGTVAPGVLLRTVRPDGTVDPGYGAQLQPSGIPGVGPEVALAWSEHTATPWTLDDGTVVERVRVEVAVSPLAAPLAADTLVTLRLSPQVVGQALLGAVDDATLAIRADPDDLDGDGVSGRLAQLGAEVGRFGWKATQPTVRAQTAAAFAEDMGITSPEHPDGPCVTGQSACQAAATDPAEVAAMGLDHVTAYFGALGVPGRRIPVSGDPRPATALFEAIGCADCHLPTLRTAVDADPPHLADLEIHPYTDLLLHDLGPELAEPLGAGDASGAEWRTPPLWGIGLVDAAPHARYLHDGRARSLEEAIAWHGGEADASRAAYAALPVQDRASILALLRAL